MKETTEDIYEKLLESQITYLLFDDPLEQYTHLNNDEKKKVKAYILNDTYHWDFAPIAEFISKNIPTTFQKHNYEKVGIIFDKNRYTNEKYELKENEFMEIRKKKVENISISMTEYKNGKKEKLRIFANKNGIDYRLYQEYLLHFDYEMGSTPVCFDEFKTNELQSDDYLEEINGTLL